LEKKKEAVSVMNSQLWLCLEDWNSILVISLKYPAN